jgi:hypothetical protein
MAKDIDQAVREVCLWFPESEEVISHGQPDFWVKGKTFRRFARSRCSAIATSRCNAC